MALTAVLGKLVAGDVLTKDEARNLMDLLVTGEAEPEQVAGVLVAIQMRGARASELAGLAESLREHATAFVPGPANLVDTCGTGGGAPSFNISTGAALVAAGAGAKVAKHGNRSVTSSCGSADVLEALGVTLQSDPERLGHIFEQVGLVFLLREIARRRARRTALGQGENR